MKHFSRTRHPQPRRPSDGRALKIFQFFVGPIGRARIRASLPPCMIFRPATVLLAFPNTARLSFSPKFLEHEPTFTPASCLASKLLALFRRQVPAALLPTARDRLALGFQLRQPSCAPRLHRSQGAGLALRRRRSGRTAAVKSATVAVAFRPIPAPLARAAEIVT